MDAIEKAITRNELARHCKRKTRGTELTAQLIEELLLDMGTATDSFGVPVFNERMLTIWKEEIKHIPCIQDPPEVALYTVTGHIRKGSMELPVYRCARGTTSLESFHLYLARYGCIKSNRHWLNGVHIVRFIPGTSASNVHFQAYLLEGLSRWNQARALAVAQQQIKNYRTFNLELVCKVSLIVILYISHHNVCQVNQFSTFFMITNCFHTTMPPAVIMRQNTLGWLICFASLERIYHKLRKLRRRTLMMMIVMKSRLLNG